MDTNKQQLTTSIKAWLQLEREINILQKELKARKQKKTALTATVMNIMKNHEIDCIDMHEGKIVYTQTKVKGPLNKGHIAHCLSQYFASQPNMPIDDMVQFILDQRPVNTKDVIKHKQATSRQKQRDPAETDLEEVDNDSDDEE